MNPPHLTAFKVKFKEKNAVFVCGEERTPWLSTPSISRGIYTFPASPVLAEHPVRHCNLVRVLHSLTRAKTPAQAGSEGRKSFITRRVIWCQGHVPAPGISLHKPQLLRSFQRRTESQRTSLPSIPSHCTNTNTCLLSSFPFSLPS